jgi:DNA-binding CsgD family transcriptional regulator
MPLKQAPDRRGRAERGSSGLLERDSLLDAIDSLLDDAELEVGGALLLEAHAGMGKTRLHEAALDRSRARGLRVLRASGIELERNVAFGVARRLLSAQLSDLTAHGRSSLMASAPEAVRELLGVGVERPQTTVSGDLAVSHGLFTLLATADQTRPAMIAIDDLHWCDLASLEFLLYLLQRLDEVPLAIVMTGRPRIGGDASSLLDRIASDRRVRVQQLAPLGEGAIAEMLIGALGAADPVLVDACRRVTAGNPFYLRELLLALREDPDRSSEELAQRALSLAPDAVARTLRVRIGRLGPTAGELARATAILGDDVPLRQAAALAAITLQEAAAIADRLAAVEILLAREPLRFVHPLVRHTVELDIPASQRASRHLDAARLIYAEGDDSERVAAHLLLGRAQRDAWVVERLRAAASAARSRGAAHSAAGYLRRALEEPPALDIRADVLAELGSAEAAAGLPEAADHFAAAASALADPRRRAELALQQGHALYAQGRHEQAAQAYEAGLAELGPEPSEPQAVDLQDELQTGFVATASIVSALHARAAERSRQLLARAADGPRTHGQRLLLAQAAVHASFAGSAASEVTQLAERAWDGGLLLERDTADGIAWTLVIAAFGLSGELERSIEVADTTLADARRRASPLAFATASNARALPRLWQGAVTDALMDLELARDARRYGWRQSTRTAAANYCLCLIEIGQLDAAEAALTEDGPLNAAHDLEDTRRMHALAELRLAQGRPREAYELAMTTGRVFERSIKVFGYSPWRTTAAEAVLAIGDRGRAVELAREAHAVAEQTDVLHAKIRALRVLGTCEGGERGLELLRSSAELAEGAPSRLETIRALVDLGSALRRANQRAAAREPLQRAADVARRGGAIALYGRARIELGATGARPRRELILEGTASLTPSERRIADLAAEGASNPEIARRLFITPKTVEYHLRNVYRKLDIKGRRDLAQALARP